MMRYITPLLIFITMVLFLGIGLNLNPREVPSPLVGKKAPLLKLERLDNPQELFTPDVMLGKVWLLNVWASWCVACREEHALLNELSRMGILDIVGLNYKDTREDALNWLGRLGNPYRLSVFDPEGVAGLDWGVYGVPETFLIDKKGIVRHKIIGPVEPDNLRKVVLPLIEQLKGEDG